MPSTPKKSGVQAYPVELSLQPLKNCLVNLPTPLTSILVDANTPAQNVIVELVQRQPSTSSPSSKQNAKPQQRSIYVGWTGMDSKRKIASLGGVDGSENKRGSSGRREQEAPLVEIDSTFAKLLGLSDGQKVGVLLHRDPPTIHTVNIEPLTPIDWEMIELHANFLEINMLSQIRALPNPSYKSASGASVHPLTLHLSPTSTANVIVTSLTPQPASTAPFAKISPDAEVIVAPKSRTKVDPSTPKNDRGGQSLDGRSSTSTAKTRSRRSDAPSRRPIFLRGVERGAATDYFDDLEDVDKDADLKVWVDWSVCTSDSMRSVSYVMVSIVHPAGLRAPIDPQKQNQQNMDGSDGKPATSIIARLYPWEEAPDSHHIALSSSLCAMLQLPSAAGETIRIESAPSPVVHGALKALRITPLTPAGVTNDGLQFGGKSRADREETVKKIFDLYKNRADGQALLNGPLTDGMLLPALSAEESAIWAGGILRFDPVQGAHIDKAKSTRGWFLGSARKMSVRLSSDQTSQISSSELVVDISSETTTAPDIKSDWIVGEPLPSITPVLVGVDKLLSQLISHVEHGSSLLLTGSHGSGKTALTYSIAHKARKDFFHVTYFPCRSLVTDETRITTIKTELNRVFGLATWNARNGGRALVILDDLDKLCPTETELEVGNDNGRSRHVSEVVVSLAKHYCTLDSRVVLLATAKGKDEINNVIIGGHMVREIVHLSSPDKDTRRTILEYITKRQTATEDGNSGQTVSADSAQQGSEEEHALQPQPSGFHIDPSIDFLAIAGQTDGYMPGDLQLLVSRARSEALIRTISTTSQTTTLHQTIPSLTPIDFTSALKGFTPSSLLNVTLQRSSTTFSSIGGLRETRQVLLETLQYPTLYAPIFAKCPLRLRSGLLLYGYPGCGKTLLASAVAGECGLNFISVKGPEILNKYIGASEKAVRDLFERAQAARPCVLFFDEFDSVAPKRGHDSTGVTDRVVNQLLTQMDGAEGLSGVYVLAATSRPDLIDPALLRPGRLDKSLLCDMPDEEDRLDIMRALCKKLKINPQLLAASDEVPSDSDDEENAETHDLREVARRTQGYSGADLQAVVYNAHLEAIHDVLGDSGRMSKPSKTASSADINTTHAEDLEFTYFRLGKDQEDTEVPLSAAAKATERAKIAQQLAAYRRAQALQKSNSHNLATGDDMDGRSKNNNNGKQRNKGEDSKEPTIEWQHIERSLAQTRPSISDKEREKLRRIYREFVVGRSGEMPGGQGSTEVGGRTSLM